MTLIARLRIILNDVDPQPMRHIEVPLKIRLDRLLDVIQAAMGWTDTHLCEFRAGDVGWGVPDPDGFLVLGMKNTLLHQFKSVHQTGELQCHPWHCIPTAPEGDRSLSTRGCRRRLGLRGVPRSPRRPRTRATRRHGPLVGWFLRS